LKCLREALEKNYPADYAAGDPELENLQTNPEYVSLLKKYSGKKP